MLDKTLRYMREKRGLTQQELAERVGVTVRQIWRYENEGVQPAADVLARIASALEASADYLIGLADMPDERYTAQELTAEERKLLNYWRSQDKWRIIGLLVANFPPDDPADQAEAMVRAKEILSR